MKSGRGESSMCVYPISATTAGTSSSGTWRNMYGSRAIFIASPYADRLADDAGLLERMRGRMAFTRRGAFGPPDVTELGVRRHEVAQAPPHVRVRAHVAR